MIKKLFIVAVLMMAFKGLAQEGATTSPYSFYGVGIQQFKGTVEYRAMGGTQVYSDSLHLNLLNPASLGKLRYTTFTVGGGHQEVTAKDAFVEESSSRSTFDYLAIGFPVSKKVGVSIGLMPYTSVGYNLDDSSDEVLNRYEGRGGINRAFVATGYTIAPGLTVGASANYNFGNIQNEAVRSQEGVELATREFNRSDFSGITFELGTQYERMITDKLEFRSSLKYVPSTKIGTENERQVSSVLFNSTGLLQDLDIQEIDVADTDFDYPSSLTVGLGIGEVNKWFFSAEYTNQKTSNFSNRTFTLDNVSFKDASQVRLGGFYTPKFNSITSYWERMTYRAGFRYEESGIVVSNEDINEFGISFGLGLPTGRRINNVNLMFELGQRGTNNANLVQENFFNVGLSLSINDLWFVQSKFN